LSWAGFPLIKSKRTCAPGVRIDAIDPNVWSGRALQEVLAELSIGVQF
jgi:hypothetical protein